MVDPTTETHRRFAIRCPVKAARYLARMQADVEHVGEIEARRLTAAMAGLREGLRASAHCSRCGKSLTDPTSVARGVGPECWAVAVSAGTTLRRPLSAEDFRPLVGRRVLVAGGFTVIGAGADTVVEGVDEELVVLRTGKHRRCTVRCSQIDSVTPFPATNDQQKETHERPIDPAHVRG